MPAISLPNREKGETWSGAFLGKNRGNLWQTFNMDINRHQDRIVLSDKAIQATGSDTLTGLGTPLKFILTNADTATGANYRWWAVTNAGMFKSSDSNGGTWTSDTATSNSPAVPQDAVIHVGRNGEDRLAVTTATNISILNDSTANTWTASWWQGTLAQAALDSDIWHSAGEYQGKMALYDLDTNVRTVIHTIDSIDRVAVNRLTFPIGLEGKIIFTSQEGFWFGLRNRNGGNGAVAFWNSSNESYEGPYDIDGVAPMTGFVAEGVPYVITNKGSIQKFTTAGFQTVQKFPLEEDRLSFADLSLIGAVASDETISPYGVIVEGNIVTISVSAPLTSRRMRSGLWVFNTETLDLYHKVGLGPHATEGTDINYGGHVARGGGLAKLQTYVVGAPRQFLIGATVHTSASATRSIIARLNSNTATGSNTGRNRGYFITPYIRSGDITSYWQGLWVRFRRFISGSNLIRVYYRTRDPLRDVTAGDDSVLQITGTWASTTTMTGVIPTGVRVGHMLEVLSGDNAGCIFPISAITDTNSTAGTPNGTDTMTVTISDTAPTSSTGTFHARFDNFMLAGTISDTSIGSAWLPFPGGDSDGDNFNVDDEIQILVETRGFAVEIKDILPTYEQGRSVEP